MRPTKPAVWSTEDHALWARIAAHEFERAGDALTFTARLARDHHWSLDRARRIVDEYRRFCFLAVRGGAVTPSEEVDEAWHQHLIFSRDYWQIWCAEVLRSDLHHQPTRGGRAEERRFAERYVRTLALYEAWFEPPPADLWPDTGTRFGRRPAFVMVDSRRHLVLRLPVPRLVAWLRALGPAVLFAAILVHAEPARAEGLGVLDWTAGPFLAFYLAAIAVSAVAARYLPLVIAAPPLDPRQGRFEPVELAMLAGGRERAADVLILEAIAAGDATVSGRVIMVDGWSRDRGELIRASAATLDGVQARLAARGLVLRPRRRLAFRCVTLAAMIPVLVLGGAKLAVGVEREKPVGILVFLLVVMSVATLTFAAKRRPATLPGRQAVKVYRAENPRAIRAPRADEVIAAFACVGAKALLCTDLSAYGELLKPSADGGGDAGGCGGGGCGGCGG